MQSIFKKAALGLTLGATALGMTATPAQAQYRGYHRHYHGRGDSTGAAIAGGILGLAVGAAIAGSDHGPRYGYDRGYAYDRGGYYPPEGYVEERYEPRYRYCEIRREWDPYWHRPVAVRVCQ